jgi:hypothetical protein
MARDARKLLAPLRQALAEDPWAIVSDREVLDRFLLAHDDEAFALLLDRHAAVLQGCRKIFTVLVIVSEAATNSAGRNDVRRS